MGSLEVQMGFVGVQWGFWVLVGCLEVQMGVPEVLVNPKSVNQWSIVGLAIANSCIYLVFLLSEPSLFHVKNI